jgi:hypothetical protein
VIEAAQIGLSSVLTTEYGAELFAPLIENGMAHVCTGGAAALAEMIEGLAHGVDRRLPLVRPLDDAGLWNFLLSAAPQFPE